ncbi:MULTISPECIES: glycosyltransferase [Ramlibacter]|uniref:Glycosyltransferase n=1 Tax=Ramlibacter pinisoli TaxID=2682844 RepID=A0A6N8ISR6_9BURK|nr:MULTISPECIES: glycosyltransferase [Ramlibacter]MBA2964912.1 glycosyltransferase [Ramlibacter sp. CGMCC 1.13660]MVQ29877.1 glycosyltransferase [Ramlibacter pinisoli]
MQTLIVFSHLRWNFVYQRPQHLLSRLARHWRVVFVEEPVVGEAEQRLEKFSPAEGVEVWRPHVSAAAPGFHDEHISVLQKFVADAIRTERITDYWIWFYTPMAVPLAAELQPRGIVYDCMDELTLFKNAPRQLVQRENVLFKEADLVFAGGPSLYNSKKGRHPSVHCFPSSVDARHFAQGEAEHPLQAALPRPRLGYCGVIDERINMELVEALATTHPDWQVVMVGPVVKIDPAGLPRHANIHWVGQQSYQDLPSFICGWDVCLMPFALNEATRFISPTKMLEYMACGRPSVSTSIRDVMEPYGHVVSIADTAADYVAACERILARTPEQRRAHALDLAQAIAQTSWDRTALAMATLIEAADRAKETAAAAAETSDKSLAKVA